jgi:hypothetical protein
MGEIRNYGIVFLILFIVMPACVKNMGSIQYISDKSDAPILSKPIIARTEPLLVTVKSPGNNAIVRWAINPSANTSFTQVNGQDTAILAFFQFSGVYRITASYFTLLDTTRPYDSSYSIVTVNDSIYISPPSGGLGPDTILIAGDQIAFTPIPLPDSTVQLYGHTSRLYKCSSLVEGFGVSQSADGSSFFINFSNAVAVYHNQDTCGGELRPAGITFLQLSQNVAHPSKLSNGIYSLAMDFNQTSYLGSMNVTDSDYTFIWNYTSGITISPLQIKK